MNIHLPRYAPRFWILGVVVFLVFPIDAESAVLHVDATGGTPYSTIQSAIDAATPGLDRVAVDCGVYHENVVMRDGVSVSGIVPDCTVIDGSQSGSVVTMLNIGPETVLERFTIRNGLADFGGGIYMENSGAVVRGNRIEDNTTMPFGSGGGIFITGTLMVAGGGSAAPWITGNLIIGNTTDETGGGIEIFSGNGAVVSNNVVANNTALVAGGGICILSGQHQIVNNTIARNCLQTAGVPCDLGGGGIAIASAGPVEVKNNAIVFNEAAFGGGGVDVTAATVIFEANDTTANVPVNFAGIPDPSGQDGNISADPLFADERNAFYGYQPQSNSPLVDAGSAAAPAMDLRGVARPRDGDADGLAISDIGARENEGVTRLGFDADRNVVRWDRGASGLHNLYRGGLARLRSAGEYTQDPALFPGARRFCGLTSPATTDIETPAVSLPFFYLAVERGAVEGSLGLDGNLAERGFTDPNRCP